MTRAACRVFAMAAWLVVMGCGDDADERSQAVQVTEQTGVSPTEPDGASPTEPDEDDVTTRSTDDYCEALSAVVSMPIEQIRARRDEYREAVAAVVGTSPPGHEAAWTAMLEFVDDDSSERLNPAADGIEAVGPQIERDCGIRLVIEDWDVLRDQPLVDSPGVEEG